MLAPIVRTKIWLPVNDAVKRSTAKVLTTALVGISAIFVTMISLDNMKTTTNFIDELGGSCIIPKVHNYPRDTDYDGYNDYQSIQV